MATDDATSAATSVIDTGPTTQPSIGAVNGPVGECDAGTTRPCYPGPSEAASRGSCRVGAETCLADNTWSACEGFVLPSAMERCDTPDDDDCDGQSNEADECDCTVGATMPCYDGPAATRHVGICTDGTRTCGVDGKWGTCSGQTLPSRETCTAGEVIDEDCDGQTNESLFYYDPTSGCTCVPDQTDSCYTGPTGTAGVGACNYGRRRCLADGVSYTACVGEGRPSAEICGNLIDEDCNAAADDDPSCVVCTPYEESSCYGGPAGTLGVGICHAGKRRCNYAGSGYDAACTGVQLPRAENCASPKDENCDGVSAPACWSITATVLHAPQAVPASEPPQGQFIAFAPDGDVLVTRTSYVDLQLTSLTRHSPSGALRWSIPADPNVQVQALPSGDLATALFIRPGDGRILGSQVSVLQPSLVILVLDGASGAVKRSHVYPAPLGTSMTIHPDAAGFSFLVAIRGSIEFGSQRLDASQSETFVGHLSASGDLEWATALPGTGWLYTGGVTWDDRDTYLALNAGTNTTLAGQSLAPGLSVAKLNSSGSLAWVRSFSGTASDFQVRAGFGHVWLAGRHQYPLQGATFALPAPQYPDGFLIHLDSAGANVWAQSLTSLAAMPTPLVGGVLLRARPNVYGWPYPPTTLDVGHGDNPLPQGVWLRVRADGRRDASLMLDHEMTVAYGAARGLPDGSFEVGVPYPSQSSLSIGTASIPFVNGDVAVVKVSP